MTNFILFLMMFGGGMAVAIQPSINSRLAQKVGVFESACMSFAVGTVVLIILVVFAGQGTMRGVYNATWWELTGGILGALFVTLTILVVPRIGTAAAMAAVIAAQLTTGVILDHYGLFGFEIIPFDIKRLGGVILLMLGAGLVFKH